jgi:hypothetical protein
VDIDWEGERESMNYMDFEPYLVHQRNKEMLREVHSLRLEEQLQANARPHAWRLTALIQRSALRMLREAGFPRQPPPSENKRGGVGR